MLKDEKNEIQKQTQGQSTEDIIKKLFFSPSQEGKKRRGRKPKNPNNEFGNKTRTITVPPGTICPRCGKEYQYIRADLRERLVITPDGKPEIRRHLYFYALHLMKNADGEEYLKPCYLGADVYDYVRRLNREIDLMGAYNEKRYLEYLRDLIDAIKDNNKISMLDLIEIIAILIDIVKEKANTEEELRRLKNLLEDRAVSITTKIYEMKEKEMKEKEKSQI